MNDRTVEMVERVRELVLQLVEELDITEDEYMDALVWLNRVGAADEFILLSDVLHLTSSVIDRSHPDPEATPSTILGPFYFPERHRDVGNPGRICHEDEPGTPLVLSGVVSSVAGEPLAGAQVDVWQSDAAGLYDVQRGDAVNLRGRLFTDAAGRYEVHTIKPHAYPVPTDGPAGELMRDTGREPWRPAHVHLLVRADGYEPKITHLFPSDSPHLDDDAVDGVKPSLVRDMDADEDGVVRLTFDVVMAAADGAARA